MGVLLSRFYRLYINNKTKMNVPARMLSRLMVGQTRAFSTAGLKLSAVDPEVHPKYYKFKEDQKILAEIGYGKPIHEKRGMFAKNCVFTLQLLQGVCYIMILHTIWKLH